VGTDHVVVRDRFSGEERRIDASAVVDCGFRLPDDPMPGIERRAGDCIAPRTVLEAVLDARRAAASI
jgi:2,4-dienoyl-CoA reductase (NADPH2)